MAWAESPSRSGAWAWHPRSPANLVLYAIAWSSLWAHCDRASAEEIAPGSADGSEIVVTAQRRAERPEDVPISLTVRSGEDLERMQATSMAALDNIAPSLVMTRTGPFTQPYIRGIGKRTVLGVENSVATYIDGVYIASSIGALLDLRGIDRVEVLNGPQGTLFGRNATGGVIQIITRDPVPQASGEVKLDAGSYGYLRTDAYLTGGSDRIAGNLAVSLSRHGGYGTNISTGKADEGEVQHSLVARSRWTWRPTETLKIGLAADYQDVDQDFSYLQVAGYPSISPSRVQNFRDRDQDAPNFYRLRHGGASIRADAEVGSLTVMSLTALRRLRARVVADVDRGPLPLLSGDVSVKQRQFSQEFQLLSGDSSRIRWVAGLYYLDLEEAYDPTGVGYGGSNSAALGGRIRQTLFARGHAASYAAYGQATLPVAKATALTLGLRYTIERRSVEATGNQEFDNPPFIRPFPRLPLLTEAPLRDGATFDELTWRAALDHRFSDELMGYVSASRGFQSGGWNLQTPQNPAFEPERLDDLEAGLKYVAGSHRFSADANIFYYAYSDLQVSTITPIGSATTNAASAEVYGLELQLDARPDLATNVTLGLQLLRARFKRFPNATCTDFSAGAATPYAPISCDVSGNHLGFAPKLKANAGVIRQISLDSNGLLELIGNLVYNSGYFSDPDNIVRQGAFATVDASVEWRPNGRGPSVRLWVLNLTDTHYYESLATMATVGVFQSPAAPRRIGVSIAFTL